MTNDYGLRSSKPRLKVLGAGYLIFVLLLGLASLSLATQEAAALFGYSQDLGHPWGVFWNRIWYAPWEIITWSNWWGDHWVIKRAISHAQMGFIFPQFLVVGYLLLTNRKLKGRSDLHGSAHWATEEEIIETGLLGGKGVYIGSWVKRFTGWGAFWRLLNGRQIESKIFLRHDGPEHILGYAPTGSGKGVGFIRPTLASYPDSAVVLDIKGENWAYSAGWRKSQGHKVFRFDPSDPSGNSAHINALEEVRLSTLSAIPDVQNIATMIVDPEGKGLQDHWSKAGFAFIAGALLHCLVMIRHSQKRTASLHDLSNMLADESKTIEQLFQEMLTTKHAELVAECFPSGATGGDQIHTFIASSAREMLNKAANESSGVVSTALVNLALYRDPVVALNTSRSDFKIHDLMNSETPVTLYLVISPADINRLRPLIRLILNLIISRICERMEFENGVQKKPNRRLLMLLDEFTSIGKMEIVDKSIAYARGYGVNYLLVIQNIEQLTGTYGKENGIKGNCHIQIAYAPNTTETQKELSEMTGKTTVVDNKTSLSGSRGGLLKNASVSVSETARALLTPDECRRLPGMRKKNKKVVPGDMLIFVAGCAPIYGRQILCFNEPVFIEREKIPAPDKSDSLTEAVPAGGNKKGEVKSGGYRGFLKSGAAPQ